MFRRGWFEPIQPYVLVKIKTEVYFKISSACMRPLLTLLPLLLLLLCLLSVITFFLFSTASTLLIITANSTPPLPPLLEPIAIQQQK